MTDDDGPEMTEREREIVRAMLEHEEDHGRWASCGTIAGLLGYRQTAECHGGRIAGGVLGRMEKRGFVVKSNQADGTHPEVDDRKEMIVQYTPSEKARRQIEEET